MSAKEQLMFIKYYNPNIQYTSIKNLYDAVKSNGITLQEVKKFIENQESNQLFKKRKIPKNLFPILANHKYEILQLDLADVSEIPSAK